MSDTEKESIKKVAAVKVKIPPFWANDVTLWFAQIEAQFVLANITVSTTKYHYVVAALPSEIAQEVRDVLVNPSKESPYENLKEQLIARTTISEQKRLQQLLTSEELGDRKPSQLLRRMRQLLSDSTLDDKILRQLFLQRLPTSIQTILAGTLDTVTLDQAADMADKIMEVAQPVASLAHVHTPNRTSDNSQNIEALTEQIQQLSSKVDNLATEVHKLKTRPSRSHSRHSNQRQRSFSRPRHTPEGTCYYHHKFGDEARKCFKPCTYQQKQNPNANASD